jgi:magnesium chelatase family protein
LERIDLHLNMPEPTEATADLFLRLQAPEAASRTVRMAALVARARQAAEERNNAFGLVYNSQLGAKHLVAASGVEPALFADIVNEVVPNSVSSRAVLRCLRVARTLADVDGRAAITFSDVEKAWGWQSESAARARGEVIPEGPNGAGGRYRF